MSGSLKMTAYFSLQNQIPDALRLAYSALIELPQRELSWKWVIIGIHSALQGSFAQALSRSDGIQVLSKAQETQSLQRYIRERKTGTFDNTWFTNKKGEARAPHVDGFLSLFEKTHNPDRMNYLHGKPLQTTPEEYESVEFLNDLRNTLLHYGFSSISVSIPSLIIDIQNSIRIVKTLLFETQGQVYEGSSFIGTISDPKLSDEAGSLVAAIEDELERLSALVGSLINESSREH